MAHPFRTYHALIATVGLAAALAVGCTQDPDASKRAHFERGNAYFAKAQYAEAILEYRNAIKIDTKFGDARFKLAESYAASNDMRNAYGEYIRAADLSPDNEDAQLKTGNLLLVAGRFTDARQRARVVLERNPKSLPGLVLLGNALAGMKDLENAVAVTERAIQLAPERSGTYTNLGALRLASGDLALAEEAFRKAVTLAPASVPARMALAHFLHRTARDAEATALFDRILRDAPRDVKANRAAAAFFLDVKKPLRAEQCYRNVAGELKDDVSFLILADFYARYGREDESLRVLRTLAVKDSAYSLATGRIALIEYRRGNRVQAFTLLGDVLRRDPRNVEALVMQTRLMINEQRYEEALSRARAAVGADPRSTLGLYWLGRALAASGDLEQARRTWTELLAINATYTDAQLAMARLHLSRNEIDSAIDRATQAANGDPDSLEARVMLVRALMVRPEDLSRATAAMDALLKQQPDEAPVHVLHAQFYLARRDSVRARGAFEQALALDPSQLDALSGLVAMEITDGRAQQARARLDARLKVTPDDPGVLVMAAKVYAALRNGPKTEALLKNLIRVEPGNLQGYSLLGQLYIAQRRLIEATDEFKRMAERDARSVAAHTMVGLLYQTRGDLKTAVEWFEKAVQIDARAPVAANNLAWLYSEDPAKLDIALQLAQTARSQSPEEPSMIDTLGWVYYKKEMLPLAVTSFQQAVEKSPGNPTYHFHLGLAHAKAGEDAKARKALEQALKLRPNFEGAEEAKKVLARLVY